ncbi:twin-arginine translocation signal domain-containing protein [Labilibacter sediminis]|nr:twin-arginine translocation signal domain-containing protein [Labilibacter sediminis]
MNSFNRRNFIKKTSAGAAGLAIASQLQSNNNLTSKKKSKTIKRKLGKTGIKVPILSIGCGGLDSPSIIKAALKVGITHFDTAHTYQKGNSERILGETLKTYDRNTYTIATKVRPQSTEEKFLSMLDESLERLQTNYVDILYLHSIKSYDEALNKTSLAALKKAKDSGKVKHIGISTHKNEPEVIQAAIDSNLYEVILTAINFKQEHNEEIKQKVALAAKNGIGIVAMKVMAGGFLDTEKTQAVNYKAALKWVLKDKNFHTSIPSMVNLEQLQANMPILFDLSLTEKELQDLTLDKQKTGLYCNACEKCVPQCTKKLPIPELMRAYMYSYGYQNPKQAKELLTSLNINQNPCIGCNQCKVSCVKNFNVSKKIKDISQLSNIPDEFLA